MSAPTRRFVVLLTVAGLWACGDHPAPLAPGAAADSRIGDWTNPGAPDLGLVGQLTSIGDLLQVSDARLMAINAGFLQYPPDPGRPMVQALMDIKNAASSLAGRAAELQRVVGVGFPPSPVRPPNPNSPPDPCRASLNGLPPDPCRTGQLGSIGRALAGADGRLAGIQEDFLPPPDADLPAVQDALANIQAEAMSLAQAADAMLRLIGGATG